jgi:hypothetical protein
MANTINADNGVSSGSAGLRETADSSGILALQTNGTTAVTVDTSQNVGIGTASPTTKLDVNGNICISGNNQLQIFNSGGTSGASIQTDNGATVAMTFNTGGSEKMRIDSSGNVGIGISSPASKLEIAGFTNITTGGLKVTGSQTGYTNEIALGGATAASAYAITTTGTGAANMFFDHRGTSNTGAFYFRNGTTAGTELMRIDGSGGLILAGSTAQKATGTTWSNPSDQRLKSNIRDYVKGTAELMQVRVREWEYNGKGGTVDGMKGLGVVADEVITVLPDTVENYDAKFNSDDEETTAIKKFDATEITWLLVKTVQEQQALITALTTRVTTLENK